MQGATSCALAECLIHHALSAPCSVGPISITMVEPPLVALLMTLSRQP
jgi:hypothetical protein